MFSKVFLVCAFAFCVAQAHKDVSGEELDKTNNPLFAFHKSFVKYPYYQHDYKHDEIYQRQDQEYPFYHHQYPYQHPYLQHYFNKYHDQSYVHPMNYIHGQDFEGRYNNYMPYHHPYYQHQQGFFNYPHNVDYQGHYYPTHYQGYQQQQGYVHPFLHKMFGYGYHHYPLYEV